MNSPIRAAFAPGEVEVAGMIVSPISSKSLILSSVNPSSLISVVLHDDKKTSVLTKAIGSMIAIEERKHLLFII
jgi:hypothetical protein